MARERAGPAPLSGRRSVRVAEDLGDPEPAADRRRSRRRPGASAGRGCCAVRRDERMKARCTVRTESPEPTFSAIGRPAADRREEAVWNSEPDAGHRRGVPAGGGHQVARQSVSGRSPWLARALLILASMAGLAGGDRRGRRRRRPGRWSRPARPAGSRDRHDAFYAHARSFGREQDLPRAAFRPCHYPPWPGRFIHTVTEHREHTWTGSLGHPEPLLDPSDLGYLRRGGVFAS